MIKTNYKEVKNIDKNGLELYFDTIPTATEREELKSNGYRWNNAKKCWYISLSKQQKEPVKKETFKSLRVATPEEVDQIVADIWNSPKMQEYVKSTADFYITTDGLFLEVEKVNKITIDKTMYYDDETEAPEVTEANFILYNKSNMPGRNLENYLEEAERLRTNGCASGRYDYNGIYFMEIRTDNKKIVSCNWSDDKYYFKRYLTPEEQEDYISIIKGQQEAYIERLKKYFKRYGKNVTTYGYWVNR